MPDLNSIRQEEILKRFHMGNHVDYFKKEKQMRDIKFRVWDKKLNKFVELMDIAICCNGQILEDVGEYCLEGRKVSNYEVMQYIGMKDKNEKEIYEGDITRIPAEDGGVNAFVVKYGIARRDMKSGWTVDIPCFYFDLIHEKKFKAFPIVKNFKGVHDLTMMEITGNIYENPELIKQ